MFWRSVTCFVLPSIESMHQFKIRVPATSANIGPGFDVVGLSLSLWLELTVSHSPYVVDTSNDNNPPRPKITYSGEGADEVPLDAYKNLTTRVALYVLRCNGQAHFPPDLSIHAHNEIPFGRGLGSSGAAVIAGVLLGNTLGKLGLSDSRMMDFALMVERHPDNVTAALLGGFIGSYLKELSSTDVQAASVPLAEVLPEYPPEAGPEWGREPPNPPLGIGHFVRFPWAPEVKAVAIIPRFELSTSKARQVLPDSYSRQDLVSRISKLRGAPRFYNSQPYFPINAIPFSSLLIISYSTQVFNMQRLAVLTTALGRSPPDAELIYEAMKDRVHQPYRKALASILSSKRVLRTHISQH